MNEIIDEFKKRLTLVSRNQTFILLSELPAEHVNFQFLGRYENHDIIWDAQLLALNNNALKKGVSGRSYIDVGKTENYSAKITVGLPVQIITAAVISKTIIMIRNYKLLQSGRHNFGL